MARIYERNGKKGAIKTTEIYAHLAPDYQTATTPAFHQTALRSRYCTYILDDEEVRSVQKAAGADRVCSDQAAVFDETTRRLNGKSDTTKPGH